FAARARDEDARDGSHHAFVETERHQARGDGEERDPLEERARSLCPEPAGNDDESEEAEESEQRPADEIERAPTAERRRVVRATLVRFPDLELFELGFALGRHQCVDTRTS